MALSEVEGRKATSALYGHVARARTVRCQRSTGGATDFEIVVVADEQLVDQGLVELGKQCFTTAFIEALSDASSGVTSPANTRS